jgi:hypothetical protein
MPLASLHHPEPCTDTLDLITGSRLFTASYLLLLFISRPRSSSSRVTHRISYSKTPSLYSFLSFGHFYKLCCLIQIRYDLYAQIMSRITYSFPSVVSCFSRRSSPNFGFWNATTTFVSVHPLLSSVQRARRLTSRPSWLPQHLLRKSELIVVPFRARAAS